MVEPIDEGGEAPCYAHLIGGECAGEADVDADPPATVTGDDDEDEGE